MVVVVGTVVEVVVVVVVVVVTGGAGVTVPPMAICTMRASADANCPPTVPVTVRTCSTAGFTPE